MIKRISIIALILLVIGIIGSIFTINTQIDQAEILEKKMIHSSDFNNIELSTDNAVITLLPTDGETKVELSGNDSLHELEADVIDDTLKINVRTRNKLISFDLFSKGLTLTVFVPKKEYENIHIKNNNGHIHVTDVEGNKIQAETDNGRIELHNIFADVIKADTDNGKIDMKNIEGEIIGKTNNGRISLVTDDLNQSIDLHSDNGRVDIQSKNKPTNAVLDLNTENGRVSVFGKSNWDTVIGEGENIVKVKTSNGRITISK